MVVQLSRRHLSAVGPAVRTRLSRYAWRSWVPVLPSKKPPVMQRSASARLSAAAAQICSSTLPAVSSLSTSTCVASKAARLYSEQYSHIGL